MDDEAPEVSDVIVAFDADTLQRLPVRKAEAVGRCLQAGDRWGARIVQGIPDRDGVLHAAAVDQLLLAAHFEMQRISEEFCHGRRVADLLRPLLAALRAGGVPAPLRLVDIGCGTGYVVRWLAAHHALGGDVELVGVDYHAALVAEARRLAAQENLPCAFLVANAFRLAQPATLYLSTGVLHHFRGEGLTQFFRQHDRPDAAAFVHFDFQPSPLAVPGAWLFHAIRMRLPLAKHDGPLSARRVHDGPALLRAARAGAPGFTTRLYNTRLGPLPRVFHSVVGVRPAYWEGFVKALGSRAALLEDVAP